MQLWQGLRLLEITRPGICINFDYFNCVFIDTCDALVLLKKPLLTLLPLVAIYTLVWVGRIIYIKMCVHSYK